MPLGVALASRRVRSVRRSSLHVHAEGPGWTVVSAKSQRALLDASVPTLEGTLPGRFGRYLLPSDAVFVRIDNCDASVADLDAALDAERCDSEQVRQEEASSRHVRYVHTLHAAPALETSARMRASNNEGGDRRAIDSDEDEDVHFEAEHEDGQEVDPEEGDEEGTRRRTRRGTRRGTRRRTKGGEREDEGGGERRRRRRRRRRRTRRVFSESSVCACARSPPCATRMSTMVEPVLDRFEAARLIGIRSLSLASGDEQPSKRPTRGCGTTSSTSRRWSFTSVNSTRR